jgi:hypothetical protein
MRMVIEARLEDNAGGSVPIRLAEFERADGELKQLGLSLAEGKRLVHEAQRALVNAQAHGFVPLPDIACSAAQPCRSKPSIRSAIERFSAR